MFLLKSLIFLFIFDFCVPTICLLDFPDPVSKEPEQVLGSFLELGQDWVLFSWDPDGHQSGFGRSWGFHGDKKDGQNIDQSQTSHLDASRNPTSTVYNETRAF